MHPFYVSICDLNYNASEKELEISVRIFTDDFEKTLQASFPKEQIDLMSPKNIAKTDSAISRYIRAKMQLKINSKPYSMRYIGHERVEESIWCYFEIDGLETPKTVHISNRILYDYRKEQTNMHNVTVNGQSKSRKIDNPESEVEFGF